MKKYDIEIIEYLIELDLSFEYSNIIGYNIRRGRPSIELYYTLGDVLEVEYYSLTHLPVYLIDYLNNLLNKFDCHSYIKDDFICDNVYNVVVVHDRTITYILTLIYKDLDKSLYHSEAYNMLVTFKNSEVISAIPDYTIGNLNIIDEL